MKAKKSLGQHFLNDESVLEDIIRTANLTKSSCVLEIGPGQGVLTEELLKSGAKVLAIEKDRDLLPSLKQKFNKYLESGDLILVENDILKVKIPDLLEKYFEDKDYQVVANIPYYITGAILEKFLTLENKPSKLVLLVQKEVAERIVEKDKKSSILSLSVALYGESEIIRIVSRESFTPAPKVESAILEIVPTDNKLDKSIEESYFEIIHSAFAHKRKKLIRNLAESFPQVSWTKVFQQLGLDENIRAEKLDRNMYLELAKHVDK